VRENRISQIKKGTFGVAEMNEKDKNSHDPSE
jgi:hypothetical protein